MRSAIRVLVVDDSALIRQMLTRALSMDPRIMVVGVAKTGVEAIEQASDLNPDVITLDIEMPEMTGLEALPQIRRHSKARVIMLSSLDDPDTTYKALALGAVDFIPKPTAGMATSISDLTDVLLKKIRIANRVSPDTVPYVSAPSADRAPEGGSHVPTLSPPGGTGPMVCVAIASSTGGPPALERVFDGLASSLSAAYVVVQHLPAGFSESLARRLDTISGITVKEADDGMPIEAGHAYLARHGAHVEVCMADGVPRLRLNTEPPVHGVRPAADVLFASVARAFGDAAVGVVLTGMGSDGARGALAIKRAGGDTIIQDEATSVVWGMPGSAVKLDAGKRVVPLGLVAAEIRRSIRLRSEAESWAT